MSIDILDVNFVKRCPGINSSEEYHTFIADVREVAKGRRTLLPVIQQLFGPPQPSEEDVHVHLDGLLVAPPNTRVEQAKALICIAVHDTDNAANEETLDRLLLEATYSLTRVAAVVSNSWRIAAAALYVVTQRADDDTYLRELLLAPDSFTPSQASKDGCFFLVRFMGFSGNSRFVPLLHDVLTQRYHFCGPRVTANALKNLDAGPDDEEQDEDEGPYARSISVNDAGSRILIGTDDMYSGASNCPDCQFFPCRINHYYAGGIEDCEFWNKTAPLGEITDKRNWGKHTEELETDSLKKGEKDEIWIQARSLMVEKAYCQAIPFLCSALLLEERVTQDSNASILPLAWIYLSDCFSVHNEERLAFIAMREALQYKNLIPHTEMDTLRKLESFDDNPETILGHITDPHSAIRDMEYKAINYKERNQWVKALDCYVHANICNAGKSGGNWFQMGECHRELSEYSLAELFMRRGAAITPDIFLCRRFADGAAGAHEALLKKQDLGLSLERRRDERRQRQPKIECGFRLDTYEFLEISETAEKLTRICQETGDYFELSKAAYERGDVELAIEIMKALVNYESFYRVKAHPLHMAARLQCELGKYDKAMKYCEWAMKLNPDDEDIRNTWTELAERR